MEAMTMEALRTPLFRPIVTMYVSIRCLQFPFLMLFDQYQSVYGVNSAVDPRFNAYGFESAAHSNVSSSTAINGAAGIANNLYPLNGPRYGLVPPGRSPSSGDTKLNGLHGAKHKRGEVDRECMLILHALLEMLIPMFLVNKFAGTRLEDLQGEIPALCKDQHGCRYLQKKLEEGEAEHRDMIFRETFGHFADLMTGKQFAQSLLFFSDCFSRSLW
jgi:hypothetical protein